MDRPIRIPDLSSDLIDRLEELYPARYPDISWGDRQIWFNAGQRSVVEFLRSQFNEQNETIIIKD